MNSSSPCELFTLLCFDAQLSEPYTCGHALAHRVLIVSEILTTVDLTTICRTLVFPTQKDLAHYGLAVSYVIVSVV